MYHLDGKVSVGCRFIKAMTVLGRGEPLAAGIPEALADRWKQMPFGRPALCKPSLLRVRHLPEKNLPNVNLPLKTNSPYLKIQ